MLLLHLFTLLSFLVFNSSASVMFVATYEFGQTFCMAFGPNPGAGFVPCDNTKTNQLWKLESNQLVNVWNQQCLTIPTFAQGKLHLLSTDACVMNNTFQNVTIDKQTLVFSHNKQCVGFDQSSGYSAYTTNCGKQQPLPLIYNASTLSLTNAPTSSSANYFMFVATYEFGETQCMGGCNSLAYHYCPVAFSSCDKTNTNQLWRFQSNRVINVGNQQCLTISTSAQEGFYFIYTDGCLQSNKLQTVTVDKQTLVFSHNKQCVGFGRFSGYSAYTTNCVGDYPLPLIYNASTLSFTNAPTSSSANSFMFVATYEFGETQCMGGCNSPAYRYCPVAFIPCDKTKTTQLWRFESNRVINIGNQQCLTIKTSAQDGFYILYTDGCSPSNKLQTVTIQKQTLIFAHNKQCVRPSGNTAYVTNCAGDYPLPLIYSPSALSLTNAPTSSSATFKFVATWESGQTECMEVCGDPTSCQTYSDFATCNGQPTQLWLFESNRVISVWNQQCLTIYSFAQSGLFLLHTQVCTPSNNLQTVTIQNQTLIFAHNKQCVGFDGSFGNTAYAVNCSTQNPLPLVKNE